jgi:hypothetical protein
LITLFRRRWQVRWSNSFFLLLSGIDSKVGTWNGPSIGCCNVD